MLDLIFKKNYLFLAKFRNVSRKVSQSFSQSFAE